MPSYFGTTEKLINWDEIVKICIQHNNPDVNTPQGVIDRSESEAEGFVLENYHEVLGTWINAGYNLNEITWSDYYPGHHFDITVQNKFADFVNADPLRVFVSEVMPGRNVPYHWDVEDHEQEWLEQGSIERWVCFIDNPRWGSVLILEDQAFHNVAQHTVYKWDSYRSWHAGTNCGIHPQYLFHFVGRPR
jgi:hypothetical protein